MKITTLTRSLLCCFLLLSFTCLRAQYVALPDTLFGSYLHHNGYAACLTGNDTIGYQLDTTCPAVINATSLYGIYSRVKNLTGITYFKNLYSLVMYNVLAPSVDSLSYLPALPASLKYLQLNNCPRLRSLAALPPYLDTLMWSYGNVRTLPALPSTLKYLSCSYDSLSTLPTLPAGMTTLICNNSSVALSLPALPSGLLYLSCVQDRLTSIPTLPSSLGTLMCPNNPHLHNLPALPASLRYLDCSYDSLGSLPALPSGLLTLICARNPLYTLPAIPASLTSLTCLEDSLTVLPVLPSTLGSLDYSYNRLTVQPPLPAKLKYLNCSGTPFTSLPPLPDSLTSLYCTYSPITSLPALPHTITSIRVNNDVNLYCLPPIAASFLYNFYIAGSHISCMPNQVGWSSVFGSSGDVNPTTLPLCTPATGCEFYYNISGDVHMDTSTTCLQDSLHPGRLMPSMKVLLKKNGQTVQQEYTSARAEYAFKTDSFTHYTVDIDTARQPYEVICPTSGSRSVTLSNTDTIEFDQDFGIRCRGIDTFDADYGVGSIYSYFSPFRPGRRTRIEVNAGDMAHGTGGLYCSYENPTGDVGYCHHDLLRAGTLCRAGTRSADTGHCFWQYAHLHHPQSAKVASQRIPFL